MNTQTWRKNERKRLIGRFGLTEKQARRIAKLTRKTYLRRKGEL